ncbi:MAG: hypothetical protein H6712_10015 [Myxococcales bacterium]|nr:hypothetical protein [Myxococcales bacterium]MCB9714181.1 hypothetical protein [Myxococcales bacterium]
MVAWRHAAVVLGLVAGLGVPTPAAAADGSDTNRWRAHLGTDLGSWVRSVPWPHRIGGPSGSRDYLGVVGVKRLRLGGGLGHGFRDRFVVGMRLDYEISRGVQRSLVPNAEARAVTMTAMPYFTVMADPHHIVRPYLSLRAGLGGGLVTVRDASPLDRPERSSSLIYPLLGLDLGAHAFVSPDVSLDGSVSLDHRWETMRDTTPAPVVPGGADLQDDAGHQAFGRRYNASIVLAVSRWF